MTVVGVIELSAELTEKVFFWIVNPHYGVLKVTKEYSNKPQTLKIKITSQLKPFNLQIGQRMGEIFHCIRLC